MAIGDTLLWSRISAVLDPGENDIDTKLALPNLGFLAGEPSFVQRIMVQPLVPIGPWANVTMHQPPYLDPDTNTIHVGLTYNGKGEPISLNVLFWCPHSIVGPGYADDYVG